MKDIYQIPLTEHVGNFQTYEMGLGKMGKGGKSRNMALKGIEEEVMTLKMKMKMRMRLRT